MRSGVMKIVIITKVIFENIILNNDNNIKL